MKIKLKKTKIVEKTIKTVAIESLMDNVVMGFLENLAELGCPQNEKDLDLWYRNINVQDRNKIMEKLLDIMERNYKISTELRKENKNEKKKRPAKRI